MEICLGFGKTADKRSEEKRGGKGGEKKSSTELSQKFHISQKSPWSLLTVFVCDKQQTFS